MGTLGKLIVAEDLKKFPQSGHIDQLPQLIFATTLWICQLGQKVYSVDSISKSNLLQIFAEKGILNHLISSSASLAFYSFKTCFDSLTNAWPRGIILIGMVCVEQPN